MIKTTRKQRQRFMMDVGSLEFESKPTANSAFWEEIAPLVNMAPNQPRDAAGRWTDSKSGPSTSQLIESDKGVDGSVSKRISGVHDELVTQWGNLAKIYKIELKNSDDVKQLQSLEGSETFGYYDKDRNKVVLAAGKDSTYETPSASPGGHLIDSSIEGVFRHEVGHAVYERMGGFKQAEWEDVHRIHLVDHHLSIVASKNHEEYFSEAFSMFSSKDYGRGDLPHHVVGFMEGLIPVTGNALTFWEELAPLVNMAPNQPRDNHGQWMSGIPTVEYSQHIIDKGPNLYHADGKPKDAKEFLDEFMHHRDAKKLADKVSHFDRLAHDWISGVKPDARQSAFDYATETYPEVGHYLRQEAFGKTTGEVKLYRSGVTSGELTSYFQTKEQAESYSKIRKALGHPSTEVTEHVGSVFDVLPSRSASGEIWAHRSGLTNNMAPNQPRDNHGRFATVPGGGGVKMNDSGVFFVKHPNHIPIKLPDPSQVKVLNSNIGGSTGAKLVEDNKGRKWVMKTGPGPDQLRNEVSADNAYRAMGVRVPVSGLHVDPTTGAVTKFARFIEGGETLHDWEKGKGAGQIINMHKLIGKGFVADALLANWDSIGLTKDNILIKDGKPIRIDNGGALAYRAQGSPKGSAFGKSVTEIHTLQNSSMNPSAASVFDKIKFTDIGGQVDSIVKRKQHILDGIADPATKATVEARLNDLVDKYGTPFAAATPPVKSVPTAPTVPAGEFTTGDKIQKHVKTAIKGTSHDLTHHQLWHLKEMNPEGIKNGTIKVTSGTSPESLKMLASLFPGNVQFVKAVKGDVKSANALKALKDATKGSTPTVSIPTPTPKSTKSKLLKPSQDPTLIPLPANIPATLSHTGPTKDTAGFELTQKQINEFNKPHAQFVTEFKDKWVSNPLGVASINDKSGVNQGIQAFTDKTLTNLTKPYTDGLPSKVTKSVVDYTSTGYEKVNSGMRQCPPQFGCLDPVVKAKFDAISKAVDNAPLLPSPVRCTRGIDVYGDPKVVEYAKAAAIAGGVYQMPSFTSSAIDGRAKMGNEVIFKILAKKGLYVEHISDNQGEREMILSPKSKYRVVEVTMEKGPQKITPHIYLEEIV